MLMLRACRHCRLYILTIEHDDEIHVGIHTRVAVYETDLGMCELASLNFQVNNRVLFETAV